MTAIVALALEWLLGDPPDRWHSVAWFGRWAAWCERLGYADARAFGVMAWCLAVLPPLALVSGASSLFGWPFDALLLWLCIGWKSLFAHVRAVLDAPDAARARRAVSRIVSRDTATMTREEARRAALESLAENASDAVVAPLFWFVLLGAPGAAAYRMVNTLDAMWGYRNARYRRFGWWAARVDDAANWLPARLTAWLMLRVGAGVPWRKLRAQAETHASPNAGWPEAALAYAADVKLGGPVRRGGEPDARPFYGPADAREVNAAAAGDAMAVVRRTLLAAATLAVGASLVR